MGASLSTSSADVVNNAIATTYQSSTNDCNAVCQDIISGVDIILNNTTTGNITFDQTCTADAGCSMQNAIDSTVSALQLATANATASSPILPIGFQVTVTKSSTTNDINTALTQELTNLCHADTSLTTTDVLIYATNSKTGDIGFLQNGDAHADCVMSNTAKINLSLEQKGTATATSGLDLGALVGLIMVVVIIIIVVGVIMKANKKNKDDQNAQNAQNANNNNRYQQQQPRTNNGGGQYFSNASRGK